MDNSSLNATEIAVGSLLAGNRGGVGGGGAWGGGYNMMYPGNSVLAANAHADGTAVKEAVDCNSKQFIAGLARVSDQAEESRRINSFEAIRDGQFQAELRSGDRLRDLERLVIDGQKEAAKCCCDARLERCEDTNKILSAIADSKATALAVESRGIERSLNAANAELTALKTQIACGCCPPPNPS